MWVLSCQGASLIMLVEDYEDLEINNNLQLDLGAFKKHSLCCLFCEETCQLVARCDTTPLNQQILSRRVTSEPWLTGDKQTGIPCGASCDLRRYHGALRRLLQQIS